MKSLKLKNLLSAVGLAALLMSAIPVRAGTVPMSDVVQEINAKPGPSGATATKLRLAGGDQTSPGDGDTAQTGQPAPSATPQTRVYTVEEVDIVKDEDCDCVTVTKKKKFPYWVFLGLAVVPFAFCCRDKDRTPPKETPPMTPPITPPPTSPPNTPVPEPMTLLLFGTGLAGVGLAARRRFRKNETGDDKTEIQ